MTSKAASRAPRAVGSALESHYVGETSIRRREESATKASRFEPARAVGKVATLPFDDAATARYGELRALLEKRGTPIGPLNTLIAAHALSLGNTREFRGVPGLKVEDWLGE